MSRIGKSPITVPSGVDVTIAGGTVTVKGPGGTLSRSIPGSISVRQDEGTLVVERPDDERESRSLHGLTRSLVNNMVVGVTTGFSKELEIVGVGYRAEAQGPATLRLALGFSHPVMVNAPDVHALCGQFDRRGVARGRLAALEQTGHVIAVETRSHALTGTER